MIQRPSILTAIPALLLAAGCGDPAPPAADPTPAPAAAVDGAVAESAGSTEAVPPVEPAPAPAVRTIELGDGLRVEVLQEGRGRKARPTSSVALRYEGRVKDGEKPFVTTSGFLRPERFELDPAKGGRPLEGLARALEGLEEGARVRVQVPAALAYGERGVPELAIAPNADLVFEVELVEVR